MDQCLWDLLTILFPTYLLPCESTHYMFVLLNDDSYKKKVHQ